MISGTAVHPAMTLEEVKRVCPVAFCTKPTNDKVSDRYVVATTADVIEDMNKLGWNVVQASMRKRQKSSSGRFSYHMIVFEHPEMVVEKINTETGEPEVEGFVRIVLTNSHDGFSAFKFRVGLFRLVCENGLIISTKDFSNMSISHINYSFEGLRNLLNLVVSKLPEQLKEMNEMMKIKVTKEQVEEFATKAYALRSTKLPDKETLASFVEATREEDKEATLWNLFNIVQEKIIKGGFDNGVTKRGKARKARKIKGFVKDLEINEKLYRLAMETKAALA